MAPSQDTGAALGVEASWDLAQENSRAFRLKPSNTKAWGDPKKEALSKRRVGLWFAAAASDTSSLASGNSAGGAFSPRDMALEASGMDTDPAECEPELVRITSLESEANSEALVRLFGRTSTIRRGSAPQALPSSPLKPANLSSLFSHSPSVTSPDRSSPLKPANLSSLFSHCPSVTSPDRSSPGTPLPVLCEDASPSSREDDGTDGPGPNSAEPSPRDSLGSTTSCSRGEAGDEAQSGGQGMAVTSAGADVARSRGPTQEGGADPTCTVDPCSWSQLSLEAILGAETGWREEGSWEGSCPEGAQEASPRDVLSSSVLDLISDPAVKAKIRSLQLYTGVATPCIAPLESVAAPLGACGPLAEAEVAQREEEGWEGEGGGEEEDCETPESEGSPPPLARTFTVKRESALEDCWLTGSQRRRKAAAMAGAEEDTELAFGLKKRRMFGREDEF